MNAFKAPQKTNSGKFGLIHSTRLLLLLELVTNELNTRKHNFSTSQAFSVFWYYKEGVGLVFFSS